MKKQYLTDIQKEVLLEMCRVMFPEIKKIVWYSDENNRDEGSIDHSEECEEFIIFDIHPNLYLEPVISIHWFELCVTELSKRVLGHNMRLISNMLLGHTFSDIHMVDYLYKHFKEKEL